ncbi:MAG: glutaredoxin family protein [Betaproteobacteria bacterium]
MKSIVPVALAVALVAQAESAQFYRWVDAQGSVHYTDKQPPNDAKGIDKMRVDTRAGDVQLPYEVKRAAEAFPVVLYSADCGEPCDAARQLLERRGIPYADKNARDPAIQTDLKKLTGGNVEVPVMQVGRATVKGWEPGEWNNALDAAGYPKTATVRPVARKKEVPRTEAQPPAASSSAPAPAPAGQPAPAASAPSSPPPSSGSQSQ